MGHIFIDHNYSNLYGHPYAIIEHRYSQLTLLGMEWAVEEESYWTGEI